jgi:hypothetical protein
MQCTQLLNFLVLLIVLFWKVFKMETFLEVVAVTKCLMDSFIEEAFLLRHMDHNTRAASSFVAVESSFHKELQMEQKLGIVMDKAIEVPSLLVSSPLVAILTLELEVTLATIVN